MFLSDSQISQGVKGSFQEDGWTIECITVNMVAECQTVGIVTPLILLDSTQNTSTMSKLQNRRKPYCHPERRPVTSSLIHLQTLF